MSTGPAMPLHRRLLAAIDLTGTFVLSIHGASVAAAAGLDLLGIVAIALISAMGGGIMRDLLVGEAPPEALRGWPLLTVALTGAVLTILFLHRVAEIPEGPLLVIDALGLSLLAVAAAAAGRCAMCCCARCPPCCVPISSPPPRLPEPPCW
jgi:uncharacterized membrane protein YeiH